MQAEVAEDLEYDLILVNKAAAEADSGFESLAVGKMLSNSTACYREIAHERVNRCGKLHCCLILRNCDGHEPSAPPPCQSAAVYMEA